jgi:hypothetical protein
MPTITADQRRKLAEQIGVDPWWELDIERLLAEATSAAAESGRSRPATRPASSRTRWGSSGSSARERGYRLAQGDELHAQALDAPRVLPPLADRGLVRDLAHRLVRRDLGAALRELRGAAHANLLSSFASAKASYSRSASGRSSAANSRHAIVLGHAHEVVERIPEIAQARILDVGALAAGLGLRATPRSLRGPSRVRGRTAFCLG